MNEEIFSLKKQYDLICQRFISGGWITVYRGHHEAVTKVLSSYLMEYPNSMEENAE